MNHLITTENMSDDQRWIRKAKQGNHLAFEKLVAKYQKRLYYSVRQMVLDHDDTNDIVQDAFVKAFANIHRFEESYPFYPWLHRIAVNTTLNFRVRGERGKTISIDSDEFASEAIAEPMGDPLQQMTDNELYHQISAALAKLPFDQRMVFVLRTTEELSYQEISEQLGISLGTVMSRLSRARAKLRELLEPYLSH